MIKLQIEIEDIFSEEEIKSIAEQELKNYINKEWIFKNREMFLDYYLHNAIKEICLGKIEELIPSFQSSIENRAIKIIDEELYSSYVFGWDGGEPKTLGAKIIDKVISKNEDMLESFVLRCLNDCGWEVRSQILDKYNEYILKNNIK